MNQARIWACDACGRVEQWGDTWSWWGSWIDCEDMVMVVLCSRECRERVPVSELKALILERRERLGMAVRRRSVRR